MLHPTLLSRDQVLGSDCEASHSCLHLLCKRIPLSEQNMLLNTASISTGSQTAPVDFLRNDIKKARTGLGEVRPAECWYTCHHPTRAAVL